MIVDICFGVLALNIIVILYGIKTEIRLLRDTIERERT